MAGLTVSGFWIAVDPETGADIRCELDLVVGDGDELEWRVASLAASCDQCGAAGAISRAAGCHGASTPESAPQACRLGTGRCERGG